LPPHFPLSSSLALTPSSVFPNLPPPTPSPVFQARKSCSMMGTVCQLFQSCENFRSHKVETLYNHTSSLLIRFSAPSFLWGQLAITVKLQKLKSWCPRPLSLPPFLSLILKIPETYLA
jgi:hypothetical protein